MPDLKAKINEANAVAAGRMIEAQPCWVDVGPARSFCPGMTERTIMHAGPPIEWERMCFIQKTAVRGAIQFEGWGSSAEEAEDLVRSGAVRLAPCHEHGAVGSMCGVISPSMSVLVVRNDNLQNTGCCLVYDESVGTKRLAVGCYDDEVLSNLRWRERVVVPVLKAAIDKMGSLPLDPIIARALTMGDDAHSRNHAATALFALELMPLLPELGVDRETIVQFSDYLKRCGQFFLSFSMAAAKVVADAANAVDYSTVVTTITRNGVEVGVRVSGLPGQWFTGPAGVIEGLCFAGYSPEDGEKDIGDSAITETVGLGAFAHAAAPALALIKGDVKMAVEYTEEMQKICIQDNPRHGIPALNGRGAPVGIDIRKVLHTGIAPIVNTAIAHRKGGFIGFGNARTPLEAYEKALVAFNARFG